MFRMCVFQEGRTALHYAALNGLSEICRILVNHGSDIDSQDAVSILLSGVRLIFCMPLYDISTRHVVIWTNISLSLYAF